MNPGTYERRDRRCVVRRLERSDARWLDKYCFRDPDQFTCQVGAPGAGPADWSGLNTSGLLVGFQCIEPGQCATGSTLRDAWTAIYSALVTVDDPTFLTVSGPTGPLLSDPYLRGAVSATLASAADNTGIRALQVRVDGSPTPLRRTGSPAITPAGFRAAT